MGGFSARQILIFFVLIALVAAAAIASIFLFLKNPSPKETSPAPSVPSTNTSVVQPEAYPDAPTIIYDGAFHPGTLLLDGKGSAGCVLLLVNKSSSPLMVGLNPHRPEGDAGPQYKPIPPGGTLLFDPRFVGVTELSFHDHAQPNEIFSLSFAKSCQL